MKVQKTPMDFQGWLEEAYHGIPIEGEPGEAFIQWKGTNVCLDFTCPVCEAWGHIDADFVYGVVCRCGAAFEMPVHLYPRRVTIVEESRGLFVLPEYDDDGDGVILG